MSSAETLLATAKKNLELLKESRAAEDNKSNYTPVHQRIALKEDFEALINALDASDTVLYRKEIYATLLQIFEALQK